MCLLMRISISISIWKKEKVMKNNTSVADGVLGNNDRKYKFRSFVLLECGV